MKKLLIIVVFILITLTLFGCGSDSLTLDTFISNYENAGISVDETKKPFSSMIGATDGVIFYMENQKVAIYEYKKEGDLKNANFEFNSVNGRFGLESDNIEAKEIFDSVK